MKRLSIKCLLLIPLTTVFFIFVGCALNGVERDDYASDDEEYAYVPEREKTAQPAEKEEKSISTLRADVKTFPESNKVFYGKASYYGNEFAGRPTASGEPYDIHKLTAAHRFLPFGTVCRVTNLANGKSISVRINDRGPFVKGRVLDLSYRAAKLLGGIQQGVIEVKIEILELGK